MIASRPVSQRNLPWRPLHKAAAQDMEVEMIDRLPAVVTAVEDGTEALAMEVEGLRGLLYRAQGATHQPDVFDIEDRRKMGLGYQQDMDRRLRVHIAECKELIIFIYRLDWDLPGSNFTEYAVVRHRDSSV